MSETPTAERITFTCKKLILRGKICVGWIEYADTDPRWRVRFTAAASGIPGVVGVVGCYRLLSEAKAAAKAALKAAP